MCASLITGQVERWARCTVETVIPNKRRLSHAIMYAGIQLHQSLIAALFHQSRNSFL